MLVNAQAEHNTVLVVAGSLINTASHIDRSLIIVMILFASLPWFYRQAVE